MGLAILSFHLNDKFLRCSDTMGDFIRRTYVCISNKYTGNVADIDFKNKLANNS